MNIIIGMTGGISAYKSCDLILGLQKTGHEVRAIMTDNAKEFFTPMTIATLSKNPVMNDMWVERKEREHIEVAKWLLSIKPTIDICTENHLCFKWACLNEYIEIAQWLQSLRPDTYELVIVDDKIISYCVKRCIPYTNNTITIVNNEDTECPICYEQVEVQTNCGHNYCTKCITDYYNKCDAN
jgi:hypothetical protein